MVSIPTEKVTIPMGMVSIPKEKVTIPGGLLLKK